MIFREWLERYFPHWGREVGPEIRLVHQSTGEATSLWLRESTVEVPVWLDSVSDFYEFFDGADLFSSTFKVCAIEEPKRRGGVEIVSSLSAFGKWVRDEGCAFPEDAVPFMYQAGIGVYAAHPRKRVVFEWDTEQKAVTAEYSNMVEVLEEWASAVGLEKCSQNYSE